MLTCDPVIALIVFVPGSLVPICVHDMGQCNQACFTASATDNKGFLGP